MQLQAAILRQRYLTEAKQLLKLFEKRNDLIGCAEICIKTNCSPDIIPSIKNRFPFALYEALKNDYNFIFRRVQKIIKSYIYHVSYNIFCSLLTFFPGLLQV